MKNIIHHHRRQWLKQAQGLGLLAFGFLTNPLVSFAKKADADEAIKKIVGGAAMREGKVTLTIPPLVENGNLVVLKVSVDSPMTANDYVKTIHVIAEGNPLPNIFTVYLLSLIHI